MLERSSSTREYARAVEEWLIDQRRIVGLLPEMSRYPCPTRML